MFMDLCVKIPQEKIIEVNKELEKFHCLRKEVTFQLADNEWSTRYSCGGFGNGYGVGFKCKDDCPLRITDLGKCKEVKSAHMDGYTYLVQDEFFNKVDRLDFE